MNNDGIIRPADDILETKTLYPFGMQAFGTRSAGHKRDLRDFTGHDLTIEGYQGVHDMQARQFIPGLGIFGGVDPLASSFPSYTPYHYVQSNPVNLVDPTGMSAETIVVPNIDDRAKILAYINSQAAGTFEFDLTGELKQVESGSPETGSTYLADRLVEAINSDKVISISIGETITAKGKEYNLSENGQGATVGLNGNQRVVVTGREHNKALDTDGNQLNQSSADILIHELVGHAIPGAVGSDTGNAVENENKVREERNKPLRAANPNHIE